MWRAFTHGGRVSRCGRGRMGWRIWVLAGVATLLAAGSTGGQAWEAGPDVPPVSRQAVYGSRVFHERLETLLALPDGGYLLGGTSSDLDDGYTDWYVTRLAADGSVSWARTYGGSDEDELRAAVALPDGGFLLGGNSFSPADGTKTAPFLGGLGDWWVVRVDASGAAIWDRTYGGAGRDQLSGMCLLPDGGVLIVGNSASTNGPAGASGVKTSPHWGGFGDGWVVRLDAGGGVVWERSRGGAGDDDLMAVSGLPDGGWVAVGRSDSATGPAKTSPLWGNFDVWTICGDAFGSVRWERTDGGTSRDQGMDVRVQPGGQVMVLAGSWSGATGNKLATNHAGLGIETSDYWLLSVGLDGARRWEMAAGGSSEDLPRVLLPTPDGGFLLGGTTLSGEGGNKTSVSRGDFDYWAVRVDAAGRILWDETYGARDGDRMTVATLRPDGGFLLGGYSSSGIGGNKTIANLYGEDFWLIALGPDRWTTRPWLRLGAGEGPGAVGEALVLSLRGGSNVAYRVESTVDWRTWERVGDVVGQGVDRDVRVITDAAGAGVGRFYRAVGATRP